MIAWSGFLIWSFKIWNCSMFCSIWVIPSFFSCSSNRLMVGDIMVLDKNPGFWPFRPGDKDEGDLKPLIPVLLLEPDRPAGYGGSL